MNWKYEAIDKLSQYEAKKNSLQSIPKELERLELEAQSIRSQQTDSALVKSSGGRGDDSMLSNIVQRAELERTLSQATIWVNLVDDGLALLSPEEKLILRRFFMDEERGAADRLAGDLHCDVKTVYRRKDAALRKFTISIYGATES